MSSFALATGSTDPRSPAFKWHVGGDPALAERHRREVAEAAHRTAERRAAVFASGRIACPWCGLAVFAEREAESLGGAWLHGECAADFHEDRIAVAGAVAVEDAPPPPSLVPICDGCSDAYRADGERPAPYLVTHHDGTESRAHYCRACAMSAAADWNGVTRSLELLDARRAA